MTNIKLAREKSGKKQQECADKIGVTLRAWQTYEQGVREPKFELLIKIADMFGVTTDYLLGRPDAKPPADPVEEFTDRVQMQEQEQIILKKWLALDEKKRRAVFDFMVDIVHEYESESVHSTAQEQIKKTDTYNSEFAVARSSNRDFLNVPDEETEKTFTRIEPDPDF